MNGRENDYLWSDTYYDKEQMIIVTKNSGIEKLSDLAGKTVGVQKDTDAYKLLNGGGEQNQLAQSFGSLEIFDSSTEAFMALQIVLIDAIAIEFTSGMDLISDEEDYTILDERLDCEWCGVAFRKDDNELRNKINDALWALGANGTTHQIAQKYPDIYDYITIQ